jgi:hypothetical protein
MRREARLFAMIAQAECAEFVPRCSKAQKRDPGYRKFEQGKILSRWHWLRLFSALRGLLSDLSLAPANLVELRLQ